MSSPRFEEARELSTETCERLGGVLDIRRPREYGPFPGSKPSREFASLTYGGFGETALSLLAEQDLLQEWDSLAGLRPRGDFEPVPALRERLR